MARFTTIREVLAAVPRWIENGIDVEAELRRPGALGDELSGKLSTTRRRRSRAELRMAAALVRARGPLTMRVSEAGTNKPVPLDLPKGAYDLVAALRMSVVNETLDELYASWSIPHATRNDGITGMFPVDELRQVLVGIPTGVSNGALHIVRSPTLAAHVGVATPGKDVAILTLPVQLDFEESLPLGTPGDVRHVVATSVSGALQFTVGIVSKSLQDGSIGFIFDFNLLADPTLTQWSIDSSSKVRPIDANAWAQYVAGKDAMLRARFGLVLNAALDGKSIAPVIRVPGLRPEIDVHILLPDVGVRASEDGGALLVGIDVSLDPSSPQQGDLQGIAYPFSLPQANAWARLHVHLLDTILRGAWRAGTLQSQIEQQLATSAPTGFAVSIDDVAAYVESGQIVIAIHFRMAGVCISPISLWYRQRITVSVLDGAVVLSRRQETDIDLLSEIFCAIESIAWAIPTLGLSVDLVFANLLSSALSSHEPLPIMLDSVFELLRPVPGTEVVASVQILQGAVVDDAIDTFGVISLTPDTTSTFVYAQFFKEDTMGHRSVISDSAVTLVDQDWPPIIGDDVQDRPPTTKHIDTRTASITVTTEFEHSRSDQVLATGKTDENGRVRFALTQDETRTTGGRIVTTVTTKPKASKTSEETTTVSYQDVPELAPDLRFDIALGGGIARTTPIANARGHVGTAASPLVFSFGEPLREA